MACGNASQYGNNAFIAPHANIQDGKMDITILSPFGPLDIAPLAIQLFTKQIDRNSKIKTFKGKEVTIIRQNPGVMHLDGEPIMADSRIENLRSSQIIERIDSGNCFFYGGGTESVW